MKIKSFYIGCLCSALGMSAFAQDIEPLPEPMSEPDPMYTYTSNHKRSGSDDWFSYVAPGAGYTFFIPIDSKNLGNFQGVSTEFVWLAGHHLSSSAPSYWRVYTRVGILKSDKDSIGSAISYMTGANFSFEKNAQRSFLIPYFGLELGGLNQRNYGAAFQIAPVLGVQVLTTKFASVNIQATYSYSTRYFDKLSGIHASATANFYLWQVD